MRTKKTFNAIFTAVVNALPLRVQATLEDYWKKRPAIDPITNQKSAAPKIIISKPPPGIIATAGMLRDRCIIFDATFVLEAPVEAVEALVAHELAHGYQLAKDGDSALRGQESEYEVSRYLQEWGFCDDLVELWDAAKTVNPREPAKLFYKYLRVSGLPNFRAKAFERLSKLKP
jgi:hypothetical protein